jgi:hypothetical protein
LPWGKIDDRARGNAKLRAIGKSARGGLWMVWGYCAEQTTNGWVPDWVVHQELTAAELKLVTTVRANGRAPLVHVYGDGSDCDCLIGHHWTPEMGGYWVHDWLVHNPSRGENTVHRAKKRELNDVDLRHAVRLRDGNACRYCGIVVPWQDKKGPNRLSIDHVDPTIAGGAGNLVVACTPCNSAKKDARTPEAAGLTLLPPPVAGTVPEDGWPKGTDPASIARAWPPDPAEITDPIAPISRDPIGDPIPDPIGDPTAIPDRSDPDHQPGHSPTENRSDQADATSTTPPDATGGALPPGRGRDGSGGRSTPDLRAGDAGPAGRRQVIGPATTPRTAASPPTYRKSATSNPPPPDQPPEVPP